MDARASMATNVILWVGVAIACGIAGYWFLQHFFNAQVLFETVNNDVFVLSSKLNENCSSYYYSFLYNPKTEKGSLIIDSNSLCIKNRGMKKCAVLYCGPEKKEVFDLSKLTYIRIEKKAAVTVTAE
ncbi:hypothetical protein J7L85_01350 [candidate division WOR-3 bacterium]|nr:hypothetical protein [candidate division WOR-3 bacterium]